MFKKVLSVCLLSIALASAQLVDDPYVFTSGAPQSDLPVMNINHTPSNEPTFAVSIHPISMLILSLFDVPSVYMTVEGNLASHVSLITRPYIIWKDFSDSDEDLDIFLFGISEGLRFYLKEGHRGFFAAAHFKYDRVGLEYTYDGHPDKNDEIHVNGFGFGLYLGHKVRTGIFTSSWDIGFTYTRFSASKDAKDDIDEITAVGAGLDINYTIGIAF